MTETLTKKAIFCLIKTFGISIFSLGISFNNNENFSLLTAYVFGIFV